MAGQLEAAAGRTVTYKRGQSQAYLTATVGQSTFESADANGVIERWESRDFIVRSSALPFGEPQRHDQILETLGNAGVAYEVRSPRGVPLWHYGDAFRNVIRIHTTLIQDNATLSGAFLTRWYGASALASLTDAQITTNLASDVADSFVQTRDIVCDGEYIYFVLAAVLGPPTFTVGGLVNTAWQSTTRRIAFTGLDYTLYRSTYPLTGTIRVSLA
jgi:hypothetical protein